jgi:hypothetical protein
MRRVVPWIALFVCGWALDCSDKNPTVDEAGAPPIDGATLDATDSTDTADSADSTVLPESSASSAETQSQDTSVPVLAGVRVAAWSPDAPGFDLCLAPQGTLSFRGPLFREFTDALDAAAPDDSAAPGLVFPQVTSYFSVAPGTYSARVVAAGATDCSSGVGPDAMGVALAAGSVTTIAALGYADPSDSAPGFHLVAFPDDDVSLGGQMALRFINAAPSVPLVSVGTGNASLAVGTFFQLFLGVPFGQAGTLQEEQAREVLLGGSSAGPTAPVDPNGYVQISPLVDATLSMHVPMAAVDIAVAQHVSAAAGAVVTFAAIAIQGTTTPAAQLLECIDNAGTLGLRSSCKVVSL